MYEIELWGCQPSVARDNPGNRDYDLCHQGIDIPVLSETDARDVFEAFVGTPDVAWFALIRLEGEESTLLAERQNPAFKPETDDFDREWQREIAMQAGMGLGVEAYNDAMGWGEDDC